jgi:hypothetical protein
MNDILSSLSIILVFVTVALDLFIREAIEFQKQIPPDKEKKSLVNEYRNQRIGILIKLYGTLIFYALIFYLVLPKSIDIIKSSRLTFWDFDILNSFFILINIALLIFILIACIQIFKVCYKKK